MQHGWANGVDFTRCLLAIVLGALTACTARTWIPAKGDDGSCGIDDQCGDAQTCNEAGDCAEAGCPATPAPISVLPAYDAGRNWNVYVENNGTAFYDARDANGALGIGIPCNADGIIDGGVRDAEPAAWNACIHAGEIRKVEIQDFADCDGLTAKDDLDAFTWVCARVDDHVTFFSPALRLDAGLASLVAASADAWRPNAVTVSLEACALYRSQPESWWSNPVRRLNPTTALDIAGAVYAAPSGVRTTGYTVEADGISVVVLPGAALEYAGVDATNSDTMLSATGLRYLWLEGRLALDNGGTRALRGVSLSNVEFSRLNHVVVDAPGEKGVSFYGNSRFNRVYDLRVPRGGRGAAGSYGLWAGDLVGSVGNVFHRITVANFDWSGIYRVGGGNVFTQVLLTNNRVGMNFEGGDNNTVSHMTVTNGDSRGVRFVSAAVDNTLSQLLIVNNDGSGIEGSANNRFVTVASTNNRYWGVDLGTGAGAGSGTVLGQLITGANGLGACAIGQDPQPGLDPPNAQWIDCSSIDSSVVHEPGGGLDSAFGGRVVDDAMNGDTNALTGGSLPAGEITDAVGFENRFRTWGKGDDASAVTSANRGLCRGVTQRCSVWDWRLSTGGSRVLNVNGDSGMPFQPDAACPQSVQGDVVLTDNNPVAPSTYLINALERFADGLGDDDGLCESNEACIYSPNLGAYQGEGGLGRCTFVPGPGPVTGVEMFGYSTNGAQP